MKNFLKKALITVVVIFILAAGLFIGSRYFVFGDGVKAGTLNYVVHKGYVFKTYEGKLIQSGIYSEDKGVRSNEFEFSVTDKEIAEKLMHAGNKKVELHYKEYLGSLPWRGYSKYVVDKIINIDEGEPENSGLPAIN